MHPTSKPAHAPANHPIQPPTTMARRSSSRCMWSVRVHGHGSFLRRLPRERLPLLDPPLDPLLLLDRPDLHLLPRPELPHVAHVPALELQGGACLGRVLPDRARSAYTRAADAGQASH